MLIFNPHQIYCCYLRSVVRVAMQIVRSVWCKEQQPRTIKKANSYFKN